MKMFMCNEGRCSGMQWFFLEERGPFTVRSDWLQLSKVRDEFKEKVSFQNIHPLFTKKSVFLSSLNFLKQIILLLFHW